MCRKMIYSISTICVAFAVLLICGVRTSVSLKKNFGHDDYVSLFRCCLDGECDLSEFIRLCRAFEVDDVCLYDLTEIGVVVVFLMNDGCFVVLRTGQLLKFKDKSSFERIYHPIKLSVLYRRGDVFLQNKDVFMLWRKNDMDCRTLLKDGMHDL